MGVLNTRPDLIHSVLFCGVPFGGGIGFLYDVHVGDSVGANKKILSPQVLATFTSLWTFFPLKEEYKKLDKLDDLSRIVDSDWNTLEIDFHSVEDWKKYKLGVFSLEGKEVSQDELAAIEKHLVHALADAKKYREEMLICKPDVAYPPVGVLNSEARETLAYVFKKESTSSNVIRGYDFESAKKDQGDARVRPMDSFPPSGVKPIQVWSTKKSHAHLLDAVEVPSMLQQLVMSVSAKSASS